MRVITRNNYTNLLNERAQSFPAVAILGPRQAGKTTLARQAFPNHEYLDLELPSDLQRVTLDPELFLTSRTRPVIIDEAQRLPELFPILRAVIDRQPSKAGQFILLGSASFSLVKQISESLAGRVAFVDLTPLCLGELPSEFSLDTHWLKGGYPRALLDGSPSQLNFAWFEQYSRTLIESDLPALGVDIDPVQMRRLLTMCAHVHGGVLNKSKLASSLGLSPHTVDKYLRIMELTFAIRSLPPFHTNVKKRLVKAPKLYLRDSGLRHYLLRVMDQEGLLGHPERGSSFEGYVVEQLATAATLRAIGEECFYFRTSDGIEVDLLLVRGSEITAIEVKAKQSPSRDDISSLVKAMELLPNSHGIVISLGKERYPLTKEIECIGIESVRPHLFERFWDP